MKQSLQLKLGQHLAMTPQLQQAIRLLQLSTMELQTEVQDALDSNLMLEAEDELDGGVTQSRERLGSARIGRTARRPPWRRWTFPTNFPWTASGTISTRAPLPARTSQRSGGDGMDVDVHRAAQVGSLQDHLMEQLNLVRLSETDQVIAVAIVDAVDDDGYLCASLEELLESLDAQGMAVELDEVQAVLRQVQQLDPPGIGARDLGECLAIQLRQLDRGTRRGARRPWTWCRELPGGSRREGLQPAACA